MLGAVTPVYEAALLVPPTAVTVTVTAPLTAGATATIVLSDRTLNDDAAVLPNVTPVAVVSWLP
jgi:hypothetical protein